MADGTLMLGEGNQERPETDDSQKHADDVVARAARYLPAIGRPRAIPVPVGYRPLPLDELPVLGFTEPVSNLYVAMTHSGVTLAPLIGELAAIEIADGRRVEMLDPYRPERFG
jgi:glycine/D-amino acid oxidase-like deaminating enzyme